MDTLYGTPQDSVYIRTSAVYTHYEIPFTRRIDFGDGSADTLTRRPIGNTRPHLYTKNGVYRVIVQGISGDTVLCADTVAVVIHDYFRPSLANKIRVTVTGVTVHVAGFMKRAGLPDSVWLADEDSFRYETVPLPEHEDVQCIEWVNVRDISSQRSSMPNRPKCRELGVSLPVMLSLDGDSLLYLSMNSSTLSNGGKAKLDTTYRVSVYGIPLDKNIVPTRERAVYSMKIPRHEQNTQVYFGWNISEALNRRERAIQRTIYTSIYDDAVITVEFYR